jgi:hypothetical protein
MMKSPRFTSRTFIAQLQARNVVTPEQATQIADQLSRTRPDGDPVYLRILTGLAAWVAASLIAFFVITTTHLEILMSTKSIHIGIVTAGVLLMLIGIAIKYGEMDSVFIDQFALALALAGNVLVLGGMFLRSGQPLTTLLITQTAICLLVYPAYADSTYRFIAPLLLVGLAVLWIGTTQRPVLFHLLIAVEMVLAGGLLLHDRRPRALTPLAYAAMVALLATLLLVFGAPVTLFWGTVPMPWLTNLVVGAGVIWLYNHVVGGWTQPSQPWVLVVILSIVLLGVFTNPGILGALGLLIIGYAQDDPILTGIAALFLPYFLFMFYYTMQVDLAYKAAVIAGSGLVLLLTFALLGHMAPEEVRT